MTTNNAEYVVPQVRVFTNLMTGGILSSSSLEDTKANGISEFEYTEW